MMSKDSQYHNPAINQSDKQPTEFLLFLLKNCKSHHERRSPRAWVEPASLPRTEQPATNGFAQPLSGLVRSRWSDALLMPTILAGNQYNHHCGTTAVTKGRRGTSSSPLSRRSYHLVVWSLSGPVRSRWSDALLMPTILAGNQYNHHRVTTAVTKCRCGVSSDSLSRRSCRLVVWSLSGPVRSHWSDTLLMPMILAGNQYNHQTMTPMLNAVGQCSCQGQKVTWKIEILHVRQVLIITQQPTEQNT